MKSGSLERDGRASPSLSNVDYVDHSAELYELPAKVCLFMQLQGDTDIQGETTYGDLL
jgi:hypothetical protein